VYNGVTLNFLILKGKNMTNITVTVGDVRVSGDADKVWNVVQHFDEVPYYSYNPLTTYYSVTKENRFGDGLIALEDMPDEFLANAFLRRLVDQLNAMVNDKSLTIERKLGWTQELWSIGRDVVNSSLILTGIINEIERRAMTRQVESLESN
jgi:hypothetical protein